MTNKTGRSLAAETAFLLVGQFAALAVTLSTPHAASAAPGVLCAAPAASGAGDCSDWDNACTLQTALTGATAGDEIWVKAGAHHPGAERTDTFTLKNGVAVYGGFAGTETGREQRDWQTHVTILSGDIDDNDTDADGDFIAETSADIQGANAHHVVAGGFTNNTAVLDGFVITAGQANGATPHDAGGGMSNQDASPRLTNLLFSGNKADGGGGMYNWNSHPLLADVTFSGNAATDGGGMQNDHYSIPTLVGVAFDGNAATRNGGGMSIGGSNADPVLRGVVFSNNTAGGNGGGVYVGAYNSSGGRYTNVLFSGNTAVEGGGMYNNNISPTLTNVLFSGNAAQYGGGMANYRSTVELINATFSGNTASSQGGAMYSWWQVGPRLKNAIVWGNSAPEGPEIYGIYDGVAIVSYSDIRGCGGSGAGWISACGTDNGGNIDADPIFADAANDNLRLQPTSPAIDAGSNALVPAGVTTDLDGNPRFGDVPGVPDTGSGTPPIVDMGAYEVDSTPPTVVSSTRAGASPTGSASVEFTVTFSETVTGVSVGDFALTTTGGISAASVSGVSGGPTAYAVTVSTGTGDGTLRLDVPATATIGDPAGNALSGLPYTDGEAYEVDSTPPTVVSSTRAGASPTNSASVEFTVTFSEAVTGVAVGDFALTTTGGVSGASVSGVSGGPTAYAVTVSTGTGDGTLRLDVADDDSVVDAAGNPLGGNGPGDGDFTAGEVYAVDRTSPGVLSSHRGDPNPTSRVSVNFTVAFSEDVAGVDVTDFTLAATGVRGAAITGVSGSGAAWTVAVNTGSGNGTLRLDVADDDSIVDAAGNPLGGIGPGNGAFGVGDVYTVNKVGTFRSVGAFDGWILESSENSGKGGTLNATLPTFSLGDDAANKQYVGILHFDTSGLPDTAVVTAVTVKIKKKGLVGTSPFATHGALWVDIRKGFFGAAATLAAADFQAGCTKAAVAKFGVTPARNWYSAVVSSAGLAFVNRTGTTQFRLRFTRDDNNDRDEDCLQFYSGSAPLAARPQLIVEYFVP